MQAESVPACERQGECVCHADSQHQKVKVHKSTGTAIAPPDSPTGILEQQ